MYFKRLMRTSEIFENLLKFSLVDLKPSLEGSGITTEEFTKLDSMVDEFNQVAKNEFRTKYVNMMRSAGLIPPYKHLALAVSVSYLKKHGSKRNAFLTFDVFVGIEDGKLYSNLDINFDRDTNDLTRPDGKRLDKLSADMNPGGHPEEIIKPLLEALAKFDAHGINAKL